MVERLAAPPGGLEEDRELLLDRRLADELRDPQRAQPGFFLEVLDEGLGIGHAPWVLRPHAANASLANLAHLASYRTPAVGLLRRPSAWRTSVSSDASSSVEATLRIASCACA